MMRSIGPRFFRFCAALVLLLSAQSIPAQEQAAKTTFYDVQISKEELYKYSSLKFAGDYTAFESPSGVLALGRTEAGVTIVIILGNGTLTIQSPDSAKETIKTAFNAYPLKTSFSTLYIRLHPKEFDETIGKLDLVKAPDDSTLAKAKELFDLKFLGSYHAGPRAIFPPYKTRVLEFDTPEFGQISNEEGYWLRLNRLSPYTKIYATGFVNPKQK